MWSALPMTTGAERAKAGEKPAVTAPRPRAQLDPETILDAATRLAAGSLEPLTVRRLGQELGSDPTAIYRHFRNKDAIVRNVLDRLVAESVNRVDRSAP